MSEQRPVGPSGHPAPQGPQPVRPAPGATPKISGVPTNMHVPTEAELEPIGLVDAPAGAAGAPKQIRAFGAHGAAQQTRFTRQPNTPGTGACRMRSFHGRLSEEGLAFLDGKINEWLDRHPEIEVKFVTTTIGVFEGKIRETALVLNVWY